MDALLKLFSYHQPRSLRSHQIRPIPTLIYVDAVLDSFGL